jgi:hypothetical protein
MQFSVRHRATSRCQQISHVTFWPTDDRTLICITFSYEHYGSRDGSVGSVQAAAGRRKKHVRKTPTLSHWIATGVLCLVSKDRSVILTNHLYLKPRVRTGGDTHPVHQYAFTLITCNSTGKKLLAQLLKIFSTFIAIITTVGHRLPPCTRRAPVHFTVTLPSLRVTYRPLKGRHSGTNDQ